MWIAEDTGVVERDRKDLAHKCSGAPSSEFCSEKFLKGPGSSSCTFEDRQLDYGGSYKQDGRYKIGRVGGSDKNVVRLCAVQTDHCYSRASGRSAECGGRSGESGLQGLEQLAAEPPDFLQSVTSLGTVRDRPVCRSVELSDGPVHKLETGPGGRSGGCVSGKLALSGGICFSTVCHDRSLFSEGGSGPSNVGGVNTYLEHSTVVPEVTEHGDSESDSVASTAGYVELAADGDASSGGERVPRTSGMENFRQRAAATGLSKNAASLVVGAWQGGTQSAYNSAWTKWVGWCGPRQIDPFDALVADVVNFLSWMFDAGFEHSTINGHRSAISAYHPMIAGVKVGQHDLVVRVMDGVFNGRPPKPRYAETWDVAQVLDHIRGLGENSVMSIAVLTHKTAMLMALCSACRGSELRAADIGFMVDSGTEVRFEIAALTKSKRVSNPHFSIVFEQYPKEPVLDVVATIRTYVKRTEEWREPGSGRSQLFLATVKPHRPVATCTVARWLKTLMGDAGVYKAHQCV